MNNFLNSILKGSFLVVLMSIFSFHVFGQLNLDAGNYMIVQLGNTTSPTVIFNNGGNYNVSVTATQNDCSLTSAVDQISNTNVSVSPPSVASGAGSIDPSFQSGYLTYALCSSADNLVYLQNVVPPQNPSGTAYSISWADNPNVVVPFSDVTALTHTLVNGDNLFTVFATYNGCTVSETYNVYAGSNPFVTIGASNTVGVCAGTSLPFTIDPLPTSLVPNSPGTTYNVVFSDALGSPIQFVDLTNNQIIQHTFGTSSCGTPGGIFPANTFYALVTATNACGQTQNAISPITVNTEPAANFTVNPQNICVNNNVLVTNTGQQGTSVANTSPYNCSQTGKFVWSITPATGWSVAPGGSLGVATGPWSLWTQGSQTLNLNFTTAGSYTITQTYANACGTSTLSQTILVGCGGQTFSIQPLGSQTLCQNSQAAPITAVVTGTTDALTYQWYSNTENSFIGGVPIPGANTSSYSPSTATIGITYYYCVVTSNVSGTSVTSTTSQIVVNLETVTPALSSPFWDANLNMFKRCLSGGATTGSINFTENTPDTYNSAIASYSINWGDGTSTIVASTVPWTSTGSQVNTSDDNWGSITHSYAAGQYTLVYTLTTSTGCTIVRNYTVFVGSVPASPTVNFPANASSCAPVTLPITLGNFSNNPIGTTYVLTFNDNSPPQTFTQQTIPTVINHTFTTSSCGFSSGGLQNVFGAQLIATNPCGSALGSASNLQVSIAPSAAITGPSSACVGSTVLFNNTSDPGESVNGPICGAEYGYVWEVLDASGNVIAPGSGYSVLSGALGSNAADPNDFLLWTSGSMQLGLSFNTPGNYTIRLKARNSCPDESVMSQTILIGCVDQTFSIQPLGSQTLCQNSQAAPITAVVTGTTDALTYQWYSNTENSFIGGVPIPGANTSSYSPSTATIGITYYYCVVTSNVSGTSVTSTTSQVVVNLGLPTVTMPSIPGGCAPYTLNMSSNAPNVSAGGGTILWYQWNVLQNGVVLSPGTSWIYTSGSQNSISPTFQFLLPGTYQLQLTVANECGTASISSNSFAIQSAPTILFPPAPTSTCSPLVFNGSGVTIQNNGASILASSWSITPNNGYTLLQGTLNSVAPQIQFNIPGTYTISLNVTTDCGTIIGQQTIVVNGPPTLTLPTFPPSCSPLTYNGASTISSNGSPITSYQWTVTNIQEGNGWSLTQGSLSSAQPNFSFNTAGTYVVELTVNNSCGSASSQTTIAVATPPDISISANDGCTPLNVSPVITVNNGGGTGLTYEWSVLQNNTVVQPGSSFSFLNGTSTSSTQPQFNFTQSGTYTIQVILSNQCGTDLAQTEVDLSFCGGNTAQANFSMDTQGCSPYVVGPVNTSVLNASCSNTTYQWAITSSNSAYAQFVAGTNSSSVNPIIQFIEPGNFTVTLTLNSCGEITTTSQQILIETTPIISIAEATSCFPYSYAPGVNVAQVELLTNGQVNNLNWSVTPNSGVQIFNGSTTTPTIQFNQSGVYTLQLEATNNCGTNVGQAQVEVLGAAISYYQDSDSDSFGNTNMEIVDCIQPVGYVLDNTDCDDSDAAINPNAEEIGSNGIDENCDGQIDNSIEEFSTYISLFPNPVTTELNLQITSDLIGTDLFVFDVLGKQISKQQILSTNTTINTSAFAAGNYVLRVGEVVNRFVVQK